MKFEKQPMVNWYNIKQLASTGVKTVISGIFGNFADRREDGSCPFTWKYIS